MTERRPGHPARARSALWATLTVAAIWLTAVIPAGAQTITLQTAAGGATVSGTNPSWLTGFGNVNGLGAGTPGTGVSLITSGVSGGVLYYTPYRIVVSSNGATVRAYVSTNFAHPTVLTLSSCYPAASCTTAASFTTLSTNLIAPTLIASGLAAGTYTAALGQFVSSVNGASAYSGADTATVTLFTYSSGGLLSDIDTLRLNTPSTNVQTAVRLLLSAAGGVAVTPASDFAASFGSVNGLGIGPAAGLTVAAATGGVVYRTPYAITTTFAGFSSTTATLKAHVSTDFAHPAVLEMRDSPDNSAFTAISKVPASPTTISSTAASGSALTRYLGMFVSTLNGAGAFTGSDNVVLTYTVLVP